MGDIYLYTGKGAGKTTNALGLALRMAGHNKTTVIIQFLKWWKKTGEYRMRNRLKGYHIYQFGRRGWKGLENLGPKDRELCERGLEKARKEIKRRRPHLLVLDELNLAVHCGMLDVKEVLEFLDSVPKRTDVVITGRHAPKELVRRAEYVNEIVMVKMPKKPASKAGIQY